MPRRKTREGHGDRRRESRQGTQRGEVFFSKANRLQSVIVEQKKMAWQNQAEIIKKKITQLKTKNLKSPLRTKKKTTFLASKSILCGQITKI